MAAGLCLKALHGHATISAIDFLITAHLISPPRNSSVRKTMHTTSALTQGAGDHSTRDAPAVEIPAMGKQCADGGGSLFHRFKMIVMFHANPAMPASHGAFFSRSESVFRQWFFRAIVPLRLPNAFPSTQVPQKVARTTSSGLGPDL